MPLELFQDSFFVRSKYLFIGTEFALRDVVGRLVVRVGSVGRVAVCSAVLPTANLRVHAAGSDLHFIYRPFEA